MHKAKPSPSLTITGQSANIKRLYIGNLDETIDEYAIVKLFEPFGKITSIEVMVHWVGPKKGLPRGFCFLEFEKKEQSLKAINALHGKVLRGKSLVVSFAHMTPEQDEARKRGQASNSRPNSLSILRGQKLKHSSTDAKIQAIERKLSLLKKQQDNNNTTSIQQQNTSKSRYRPY
ncbi:unnamed protein product [Mucor hiemalis]